jgi:putative nucleotidyltransferase with HDIG domain
MPSEAEIRARIQKIEKLPTISAMQPKIFAVIQKKTATVGELVDVVKHDQVMASRIVAMANAPAFGYGGPIRDIDQAVFVLGFDAVKNIALGISLFVVFPLSKTQLKGLWTHSCSIALLADSVYARAAKEDRGVCFLGGLLHDIGRLVLMHLEGDVYLREIIGRPLSDAALLDAERRLFGCDHQQAGAWFLDSLSLPTEMGRIAACHHAPETADEKGDLPAAICLAEALSIRGEKGGYADGAWTEGHERLAGRFGLADAETADLVSFFESEKKRLKGFFGFW